MSVRPLYSARRQSVSKSQSFMKVAVNSSCRVNPPRSTPLRCAQPTSAGGNTAVTSAEAPIASRTGRST